MTSDATNTFSSSDRNGLGRKTVEGRCSRSASRSHPRISAARADEGRAVVLAIHDLNAAARYADELVLLWAGRIVARGPPAEVLTDFGVRAERVIEVPGRTALLFHLPGGGAESAEKREDF